MGPLSVVHEPLHLRGRRRQPFSQQYINLLLNVHARALACHPLPKRLCQRSPPAASVRGRRGRRGRRDRRDHVRGRRERSWSPPAVAPAAAAPVRHHRHRPAAAAAACRHRHRQRPAAAAACHHRHRQRPAATAAPVCITVGLLRTHTRAAADTPAARAPAAGRRANNFRRDAPEPLTAGRPRCAAQTQRPRKGLSGAQPPDAEGDCFTSPSRESPDSTSGGTVPLLATMPTREARFRCLGLPTSHECIG